MTDFGAVPCQEWSPEPHKSARQVLGRSNTPDTIGSCTRPASRERLRFLLEYENSAVVLTSASCWLDGCLAPLFFLWELWKGWFFFICPFSTEAIDLIRRAHILRCSCGVPRWSNYCWDVPSKYLNMCYVWKICCRLDVDVSLFMKLHTFRIFE